MSDSDPVFEKHFENIIAKSKRPAAAWKWRVIVRLSLQQDTTSKVRGQVAKLLEGCGIKNTGTGSWESAEVSASKAAAKLSKVLTLLAQITETPKSRQASLDHIWVYIDRVKQRKQV
jgi:hypothetical protein